MQAFLMLVLLVSALWTPHLVSTGVQRARYYCRSHGITESIRRGAIRRPGFKL